MQVEQQVKVKAKRRTGVKLKPKKGLKLKAKRPVIAIVDNIAIVKATIK